jgi:hypothetical protein
MSRKQERRLIQSAQSEGHRRGVVLGLTIAEIILLILFALLLAMTGVLIKKQAAVKAQFEAKTSQKVVAQILSPVISQKLFEMDINITKEDGEARLLAILNAAQALMKTSNPKDQNRLDQACKAGLELQNALGKNLNAVEFIKSAQQLSKDLDTIKAEAARCNSAAIAPPCYEKVKGEPTAFIYDLRVTPSGIIMSNTVAEQYRNRFEADFKNPPPVNKPLSIGEFQSSTRQFIDYGRAHQCKFYVKVYDETGDGKGKFKSALKSIEENFVWTFMMTTKADEAGKSINLFPTESTKIK